MRGPQIVDPITGVVQDQRDVEQGLAERVRRIEEQTSAIPAITKAVNRMEATLQNGGVRAKLSLRDVAKVAFYVGVVLAAVVEGLRFVSGL